ncbi:hypothetical protein Tco_0425936 [Tanacetum coccineum]
MSNLYPRSHPMGWIQMDDCEDKRLPLDSSSRRHHILLQMLYRFFHWSHNHLRIILSPVSASIPKYSTFHLLLLPRDHLILLLAGPLLGKWIRTMPNIRSGATMTREAVDNLIGRRVAEVLEACDAARNLEPLAEGGDEQGGENGDDYEGGNGGGNRNRGVNGNRGNGNRGNKNGGVNGNGNGGGNDNGNGNRDGNGNGGGNGYENHNVNFGGFRPVARECTYQDILKCQPINFKGTEGVVGLTRWFEKMEMVFHISNCPQKNQVKYATCTLLDNALTWWNTHKRTIGIEAAYAMTWTKLMKLPNAHRT